MKIKDIKEHCQQDEKHKIELDKLADYYSQIKDNSAYLFNFEVTDSSFLDSLYDSDLVQGIKNVIGIIQNCLTEEQRLTRYELTEVVDKILTIHSNRVLQCK